MFQEYLPEQNLCVLETLALNNIIDHVRVRHICKRCMCVRFSFPYVWAEA